MVIGGPDGYCVVLSPQKPEEVLELKGHVGDVLNAKWFPSGEVSPLHAAPLADPYVGGLDCFL